jgi:hypothetical protein
VPHGRCKGRSRTTRCCWSATPVRSPSFPPIGLFPLVAEVGEGTGGALYLGAARTTEFPKLGGGALVMKHEVVEFEGVYLAGVQLPQARSS